jgi:copper chaperone
MTDTSATIHVYRVPEMSCDHCRNAIETNVGPVDGVTGVAVDLDAKTVTVTGGQPDDLIAAIDRAGFDVAS